MEDRRLHLLRLDQADAEDAAGGLTCETQQPGPAGTPEGTDLLRTGQISLDYGAICATTLLGKQQIRYPLNPLL
ncbi:MAG: hypothetical protein R3C14_12855 [Caldilineaceae bacterium]